MVNVGYEDGNRCRKSIHNTLAVYGSDTHNK